MGSREKERTRLYTRQRFFIIIGETSPERGIKNLNIRKLSDFGGFQSTEMREFFFLKIARFLHLVFSA